jgi:hypothetical protein
LTYLSEPELVSARVWPDHSSRLPFQPRNQVSSQIQASISNFIIVSNGFRIHCIVEGPVKRCAAKKAELRLKTHVKWQTTPTVTIYGYQSRYHSNLKSSESHEARASLEFSLKKNIFCLCKIFSPPQGPTRVSRDTAQSRMLTVLAPGVGFEPTRPVRATGSQGLRL